MSVALEHRGPDDHGTYVKQDDEANVILVHRRLAIIDLSAAGHQPMTRDACVLVFNGEIFNYRELRSKLRGHGHSFRTDTDTEVLLAAYAEWGTQCVDKLRGMFAFAVWNETTHTLFAARDQLGVKPLYYAVVGDGLVFASEVRAILASGLVPRRLDTGALAGYLTYGAVQDPQTLVAGVVSLEPGCYLTWQKGRTELHRYWNVPMPRTVQINHGDITAVMDDHLSSAVRSQLVADVPLAAFLSGGIDSVAIVALMRRAGADVRTVSIVFEESQYDEREFSRLAAQHFGTTHLELSLSGKDVVEGLPHALAAYDQPSVDGLNTYFVSKITREAGLGVALSGTGGDEVFGGYSGHAKQLLAERAGRVVRVAPRPLRTSAAAAIRRVTRTEQGRRFAELLATRRHPYFLTHQIFTPTQSAALLSSEAHYGGGWEPQAFALLEALVQGTDPVTRAATFELRTFLLSILLRDTDQMSMANALEVRVPLLDHRLVEFVYSLPGDVRLDRRWPKPLLTKTLRHELPPACVHRAKRGFELPFASWLRGALQSQMRDSFMASGAEAAPFEPAGLRAAWAAFEAGRLHWSRVWAIFVLRDWLERHQVALG